jgi:hypothetical protein
MDDNQVFSIVALAISIGSTIIGIINHKRIRSNCCGVKQEISLDIETTTPVDKKNNPMIQ